MANVVVLDYGSSNLRSVAKALEAVSDGHDRIVISGEADRILAADRVVFPGQGAIGQCMSRLQEHGLDNVIKECIASRPFLGICLGLQSLMEHSAEDGGVNGLGILPGQVLRFDDNVRDKQGALYKIPSMGWNQVKQEQAHPIW